MFKPNYTITDTIVRHLTEIAEARAIILHAPLVPKWEIDLRRQALLQSTHASTSIEGNMLSLEEVSDLMVGRDITARARDKKEVVNYFEALNYLDNLKDKEVTEEDILHLHGLITKGTLDEPSHEGHYRTPEDESTRGQVVVAERIAGVIRQITFVPPKAAEVPQHMKEFTAWLNSEELREIDPVLAAGVAHYELVRIHPFIDGNGRTARVLASLVLLRQGFDTKRFFALDDFYNSDRSRYYQALKTVQKDTIDLSQWLEYFTEGVAVSIKSVKDKVLALTGGRKKTDTDEQIALDLKQVKVVEFLQKEHRITNKQIRELLNVSHETAHELVQSLMAHKVIKPIGKGRATHYVLRT